MRVAQAILVAMFGTCLLLTACVAAPVESDVPATVIDATAQSRNELQRVIAAHLKQPSVVLADDALVHESSVIIEPVRPRDAEGQLLQGRETRRPEVFRLVKHGRSCILIHERSGARISLDHIKCVAMKASGK